VPRPVSRSADQRPLRGTSLAVLGTVLVVVGVILTVRVQQSATPPPDQATVTSSRATAPDVGHVFVVNIENKGFRTTWGKHSRAPYMARTLRAKGVLLTRYYGTAHHSLGNYLAQISGQGPDLATQGDCPTFSRFKESRPVATPGQVVGNGCVYPAKVGTLPRQLTAAGLSWRGYMQDMATPCQHPRLGTRDRWQKATRHSQYATRHDPFVYFRSIISAPSYCKAHVKPLAALSHDLKKASTTRSLTYVTPDLCHDAHDAHCADGGPGGLRAANTWFKTWIPKILRSPAFKADGVLVITADESEGVREDSRGCCGEGPGPNAGQPGIEGRGGGRIGALVISRFAAPGTTTARAYNHYSLLGSIEDRFGLPRLGYARTVTHVFGPDVYNAS
jgi:phosphatidylinositol-3-phosphatase